MKNRKAQAAVEYLSTYGWAVLVIALVLAALMWLGVFDTQKKVPNTCTFDAGIYCDSIKVSAIQNPDYPQSWAAVVSSIRVTNHHSERIALCGIEARTGNQPVSTHTAAQCANGPRHLEPGESHTITSMNYLSASPLPLLFILPPIPIFVFDGDTGSAYAIGGPGSIAEFNVFIHYVTESDSGLGNARVARGRIRARVDVPSS